MRPDLSRQDASEILPRLYQGSAPVRGAHLAQIGFGLVVLCAYEYQPRAEEFHGIDVVHAPNDDDGMREPTRRELELATSAGREVARRLVQTQENILVTCMAGLNRSGLVNAIALHLHTGWSGKQCVEHIQTRRKWALSNPRFQELLEKLPARTRRVPKPVRAR